MEDVPFDVVIEGLFGYPEFRMAGNDLERGLSLPEKGCQDSSHGLGFLDSEVDAGTGIGQSFLIIKLGTFRRILIFAEMAAAPIGTAVAGTGGTVSSGAAEGGVFGAVRGAIAFKDTFAVVGAFQRHLAFVGKDPMELNFLTDSGFVFPNGLGDGGLGGTVGNTGEDDTPFL